MKKVLFTAIIALLSFVAMSQEAQNVYVSASALNMRSEPNTDCEVISELELYDNLELINDSIPNWYQVKFNGETGYVYSSYVKPGRAVVTISTYRTGAKCKDGTTSTATGRGACSHHGGVAYWLTQESKSVKIIN